MDGTAAASKTSRDIARLGRRDFWANQRRIAQLVGAQTEAFARYEKTYRQATSRLLGLASRHRLLQACRKADWVGVGDYHTLNACRVAFLDLLIQASPKRPIILGLEYFASHEQPQLDAFVRGTLGLGALRRQTHHGRGEVEAGDASWQSYVPLLKYARSQKMGLLALDPPSRGRRALKERDASAAETMVAAWRQSPQAALWILAGQLHLAPAHLPRALATCLGRPNRAPLKSLAGEVVYQNCEQLYFRLLAQGLTPEGRILQLSRRSWALMHTPPAACQLSFLASLEG